MKGRVFWSWSKRFSCSTHFETCVSSWITQIPLGRTLMFWRGSPPRLMKEGGVWRGDGGSSPSFVDVALTLDAVFPAKMLSHFSLTLGSIPLQLRCWST